LREYAASRGILVVEEFVDTEIFKTGDSDGFPRMVQYLRKHRATCRTFRRVATGIYCIKALVRELRGDGLTLRGRSTPD